MLYSEYFACLHIPELPVTCILRAPLTGVIPVPRSSQIKSAWSSSNWKVPCKVVFEHKKPFLAVLQCITEIKSHIDSGMSSRTWGRKTIDKSLVDLNETSSILLVSFKSTSDLSIVFLPHVLLDMPESMWLLISVMHCNTARNGFLCSKTTLQGTFQLELLQADLIWLERGTGITPVRGALNMQVTGNSGICRHAKYSLYSMFENAAMPYGGRWRNAKKGAQGHAHEKDNDQFNMFDADTQQAYIYIKILLHNPRYQSLISGIVHSRIRSSKNS